MFDLVEAVMAATEDQIAEAFAQEVAIDQFMRVVRRIKFILHPDRNTHPKATDAFQRLSSSSWRLKYTKHLHGLNPNFSFIFRHEPIMMMPVA